MLTARARLGPSWLALLVAAVVGLGLGACVTSEEQHRAIEPATSTTTTVAPAAAATTASITASTSTRPPAPPSFVADQLLASPREAVPPALVISQIPDEPTRIVFDDPAFGPALVRSGDVKAGGPPPDGIPSIDRPRFHRVADVTFLTEREPVLAFNFGGESRAYPLQVLIWHEIVNDTVAGVPVAVTYCPLCNSAHVFDRRAGARTLEFGVSGALWNSSLVMYDRQTLSLWGQFTGQGILGVLAGNQLTSLPATIVSWEAFRRANPNGVVLSRDTGFAQDYGRNPYPGYDDAASPPFAFEGPVDGRYAAKTRVLGVSTGGAAAAVTWDRLRAERVVTFDAGGRKLVALFEAGALSAVDGKAMADSREVGAVAVFDTVVDGQELTFTAAPGAGGGGGFADHQTNSTWDIFGTAVAGPLAGRQLSPVSHLDTFWFAWSAFWPSTTVIG